MNEFKLSRKFEKKKTKHSESEYSEYKAEWQTKDIGSNVIPVCSVLKVFMSYAQNTLTGVEVTFFLVMCVLYFFLEKRNVNPGKKFMIYVTVVLLFVGVQYFHLFQ